METVYTIEITRDEVGALLDLYSLALADNVALTAKQIKLGKALKALYVSSTNTET